MQSLTVYDVAVVGGGVLGTCVSYWISSQYDANVCVIEKEPDVAVHASSRNTGVVHSPFYLNPDTKGALAGAALESYPMWEGLARDAGVPWKKTGVLELALDESQHQTLQKYMKWARKNGVNPGDIEILDQRQVMRMEPNIRCHSAIHSSSEASADFGALTRAIKSESERLGTRFMFGSRVSGIRNGTISLDDGKVEARLIVNCAGGNSLDVAQMTSLASGYSDLHFRGEYWTADSPHDLLAGTTVYTVAEFAGYPFLDPHWIKRADGTTEVGPNAVPVPGPETYEGYVGDVAESLSKLKDVVTGSAKRLLANPEFLSLVSKEWLSSLSKGAMIRRVQRFLPDVRPEFFTRRGTAGIRSPVITPEGRFLEDVMELEGDGSFHVINYNSPGATGAPAYSAHLVRTLRDRGLLECRESRRDSVWRLED
ncbi:MAG: FAD-dependent oxidoreductase [Nitrosopumilus sp. H13]|nr:MAG: FAD-dependent oxidoreductase [Nitrosopumilus sp. H13]